MRGVSPSAARASAGRGESFELPGDRRMRRLLRHRQVAPQPLEAEPRVDRGADELHEPLGTVADPAHPGVDLHVDAHRPAHARRGLGQGGASRVGVEARGQPCRQGVLLGPGRKLAENQRRGVEARLAEAQALLDQRHSQPGGAGLQGGAGDRHVAVAVAIGLHDPHELRPGRLQGPHVVTDRVEIDLHGGRAELAAHAVPRTEAAAAARRSATSTEVAPSPRSSPARRPASPCT